MTTLGVVVVHFHTPHLARAAVASLREQAAQEDLRCEVVIVDNGSTPESRAILEDSGAEVEDPGRNLGYAGGFNRGVGLLEKSDVWMVMNPDLKLLPGCLKELLSALGSGAGVVGPRFFWDRADGFLLPPAERRGRRASVGRFLASRVDWGERRARRAWRRNARRHWQATVPLESHDLSGALLAIDADAWRRIGPFDEGYPLYFEETDWLERARRGGIRGLYVPAARAIHHYAQSTPLEPRSQDWFQQSHQRFRRKHYGATFTRLLHASARRWPEPGRSPLDEGPGNLGGIRWLEIAAGAQGFPAASRRFDSPPTLDALRPASAPAGRYVVRALGEDDRELWVRQLIFERPKDA